MNGARSSAGAVILFLLGVATLRLTLDGDFANFVKPGHRPWLLIVGAGLAVWGVIGLVRDLRSAPDAPAEKAVSRRAPHTDGPLAASKEEIEAYRREHDHGHDHRRIPGVAWLLLLPVLLVLLVPPPALGAFAAARSSPSVPQPPTNEKYAPLAPGDPANLQVYDYAERATWDDGRTLAGREVELTGFATPRPDGGWYLSRLRISCCAADARAYLVEAMGDVRDYPANTWMRVTGTFVASEPGTHVARLQVAHVDVIGAPAAPYEQ